MKILGIETHSLVNGPGLRTVVWCAGCSHHCKGCHNPETWNPAFGEDFSDEMVDRIIETLSTASGLTVSGGDPMYESNRNDVLKLVKKVKERTNKDIWMWTGYLFEDVKEFLPEILDYIDILVDGPFIESKKDKNLKLIGSSNQRVIDVKRSLSENKIVLYG